MAQTAIVQLDQGEQGQQGPDDAGQAGSGRGWLGQVSWDSKYSQLNIALSTWTPCRPDAVPSPSATTFSRWARISWSQWKGEQRPGLEEPEGHCHSEPWGSGEVIKQIKNPEQGSAGILLEL